MYIYMYVYMHIGCYLYDEVSLPLSTDCSFLQHCYKFTILFNTMHVLFSVCQHLPILGNMDITEL